MADPISAIAGGVSAVAGIAGAKSSGDAAVKAAKEQSEASKEVVDLNRYIFEQEREDAAPFRDAGYTALEALSHELLGTPAPMILSDEGQAKVDRLQPFLDRWNAQIEKLSGEISDVDGTGEKSKSRPYANLSQSQLEAKLDDLSTSDGKPGGKWWQKNRDNDVNDNSSDIAAVQAELDRRQTGIAGPAYGADQTLADDYRYAVEQRDAVQAEIDALYEQYGIENQYTGYQESPGYQRQLEEGQESLATLRAITGGLDSTAAGEEFIAFGQDLADADYQTWLQNVFGVAGFGPTGAALSANAGQAYATNAGNAIMGGANARAAGIMGEAQAQNNQFASIGDFASILASSAGWPAAGATASPLSFGSATPAGFSPAYTLASGV